MKTRAEILEEWPEDRDYVSEDIYTQTAIGRQNAILRDLLLDVRGMMVEVMASAPEYYGTPIMEIVKQLDDEMNAKKSSDEG